MATVVRTSTRSPLPALFLLALFAAAAMWAVLQTPVGRVLTTPHAEKHAEADAIRDCLERHGPAETWRDVDDDSIYIFCVELEGEPCSKLAIMIAQVWPSIVDGCSWRERTSFTPRNGEPSRVHRWLGRIAERIE